MKKKINPIFTLIKKKDKQAFLLPMNMPLGNSNSDIDYFNLKNAKFTPVPVNLKDRETHMRMVKSKMDLSILNKINKKCILDNERKGDDREGIVFKKTNPILSINPNLRPNAFSWSAQQFNRRIVGKMIVDNLEYEKCKIII